MKRKAKTMLSPSFKAGFVRGFTAPTEFFAPRKITRPKQFDASIERAWKDVGRSLDEATVRQGAVIEQKAGSSGKRSREAA